MSAARPIRFWLAGLLVFGLLLWLLSEVLMPFAAAMAVAYLLDPLVDRIERIGTPRWLATTLVLLAFFAVATFAVVMLVPIIQAQIASFIEALPAYRESLLKISEPLISDLRDTLAAQDLEQIRSTIGGYAGQAAAWAGSVLAGLWRGGVAIIDIISLLVITPVVAFYLLRDWDRMIANIDAFLPRPHVDEIRTIARDVNRTLARFVRGQGTVCLILGGYYAAALGFVGLDFGIVVGMGAGLLSFIPFVGTITGFIVSMVIALVQFEEWTMWLLVAGLFIAGQVVEGNFLTPKLVGESVGLHPVWVMFALLAGGSLFGFTGVLLAVPVAAVIGVLVRFFLSKYLASPYFRGAEGAAAPGAAVIEDAAP